MKDYGGFGDEPFYDLDGNGKLDFIEESLMHADLDLQMLEMDNELRSSGSPKRRKKNSFWREFWHGFWHTTKILNFGTALLVGWLSALAAEMYGETENILFFILAVILLICMVLGLIIEKPQK